MVGAAFWRLGCWTRTLRRIDAFKWRIFAAPNDKNEGRRQMLLRLPAEKKAKDRELHPENNKDCFATLGRSHRSAMLHRLPGLICINADHALEIPL